MLSLFISFSLKSYYIHLVLKYKVILYSKLYIFFLKKESCKQDSFSCHLLLRLCTISEEEVSQWCVVHAFDSITQHIFLCIEVQRINYVILTY